ncbi:MAG: hypothetical protein PHO10_00875 [Gemmiger sp.]|nr:hypothetical protein [Gemmiger sp.]
MEAHLKTAWRWLGKHTGIALLLILELLVLVEQVAAWNLSTETTTLTPGQGIVAYTDNALCDETGLRLSEAGTGFTGIYGTTRWLALRAGCYKVTARYTVPADAATGGDGYMEVYSDLADSNRTAIMAPTADTTEIYIWLPQRVEDLQLRFYLNSGNLNVTGVTVEPVNNTAALLGVLLAFALLDGLVLLFTHRLFPQKPKAAARLLLLGAVAIFASVPALAGLQSGDDLTFHLNRIEGLAQGLAAGQFPVFIQPHWFGGQGYPVSVFYGDILLYFPALLRAVGLPLHSAYHAYLIAINLGTVAVAWWAFRHIFKSERAGLLGALLYTLAPYRLTDLYRRAALGEYTALLFAPLILAGLWDVFTLDPDDPRYRWCWLPGAVGFAGMLQCHLISTELFGLATILTCLCLLPRVLRPKTFWALAKTAGGALLASAWFLIPFADYMRQGGFAVTVAENRNKIQTAGSYLGQIFRLFSPGGATSQGIPQGAAGDMLQTPGAALLLGLLLFALCHLLRWGQGDKTAGRAGRFGAVAGVVAIICCLWTTPWDLLLTLLPGLGKVLNTVQFPWRYMGLACLFLALAACAAVAILRPKRALYTGAICLLAGACVLEAGYTMSSYIETAEVLAISDAAGVDSYNCGSGEYLPAGFAEKAEYSLPTGPQAGAGVQFTSYEKTGLAVTLAATAPAGGELTVPLLDYPYYRATAADGTTIETARSAQGQITLLLPAGFAGTVQLNFCPPWYWYAGWGFSALFCLWVWGLWCKRNSRPPCGARGAGHRLSPA